jgi:hypothetical protein
MTERPDYTRLQQSLEKSAAEMYAAEAHGALCGMVCASGKVELGNWLEQVFEQLDLNDLLIKEASQQLVGLFQSTQEQLNDPEAGFDLLLPGDDTRLEQRTEALAQWCQGFTFGLAAGGLKRETRLPDDTAELIQDMVQIAQVEHDDSSAEDTDEDAYMQVYEYVRMGVLLINEELQPLINTGRTQH